MVRLNGDVEGLPTIISCRAQLRFPPRQLLHDDDFTLASGKMKGLPASFGGRGGLRPHTQQDIRNSDRTARLSGKVEGLPASSED